jgi:hypothetical protein
MEKELKEETESYLQENGMHFGMVLHPANNAWETLVSEFNFESPPQIS